MTTQTNRELVPRPRQHVTPMASPIREFTRMSPPTFYGSKVVDDPKELIDKVSKILFAIRFNPSEKAEWDTYKLKNVAQHGLYN